MEEPNPITTYNDLYNFVHIRNGNFVGAWHLRGLMALVIHVSSPKAFCFHTLPEYVYSSANSAKQANVTCESQGRC